MEHLYLITATLLISMLLVLIRFLQSNNSYEKIIGFYVMFTLFILLFLSISSTDFGEIFDIIVILFLLKLVAVLFLLFNRKKI